MSEGTGAGRGDFWYNVVTKQVEVGAQSDWSQLIGPYATRAEAENAPAKVAQRNEAWDAQDEA
ncbi:MAG: SPOR domain-containing protein [Arthrobacter sp.]|uniref:SPOR domain-containing protein n=1 Tax=Arthrobacter sp. TaxID=1667 RepID=UPI00346DB022